MARHRSRPSSSPARALACALLFCACGESTTSTEPGGLQDGGGQSDASEASRSDGSGGATTDQGTADRSDNVAPGGSDTDDIGSEDPETHGEETEESETCPLPTSFTWTSSGVLADPADDDWFAIKDFTVTRYDDRYIVYGTVANGGWNGFFSTFESFDEWSNAEQHYHLGHVAPTLFYFEPKDVWVLAYQWDFQYKTTKTPDVWASWSSSAPLILGDPTGGRGTGPIDQTIICDDTACYIFFNDDAGGVYRGSMPIDDFPGTFTGITRIMDEPTNVIFEGIQVYSIKGSDEYLMIIENNGTRRFLAWSAESLDGTWTPLPGADSTETPFAGQANTTWQDGKWTNDISHGDLVREDPSQKMEIDPCHLRMLYQGQLSTPPGTPYDELPYRPGLLTLND